MDRHAPDPLVRGKAVFWIEDGLQTLKSIGWPSYAILSWSDGSRLINCAPESWLAFAIQSAKWRFFKRTQLSGVERLALALQELDGGKTDLKVLRNRRLIKGVGGSWQLDFTMQWLVRYAEQSPIRHPETKTLCSDRAALHVDGNRSGQIDPAPLLREPQFPVAIVIGHDRTGAKTLLERFTTLACNL